MLAETRRTVQQMHPDVARRLHLTAEEANQLLDLMSEHMMRRREGFASGDNTFSQESFEERLPHTTRTWRRCWGASDSSASRRTSRVCRKEGE